MKESPLQFEHYYIESQRFSLVDGYEPDDAVPLVWPIDSFSCDVHRADLEATRYAAFRLSLKSTVTAVKFPYEWEISLVGHFRLADEIPDAEVELIMDANAPAVLYGAAREALAAMMGRGPFRAPMLPSVHFLNLQRPEKSSAPEAHPARRTTARKAGAKAGSTKARKKTSDAN